MSANDLSAFEYWADRDYIERRLRVLESQKEVLVETAKWKGRSEIIAAILSAGSIFANIHGIPVPPVTPGMVDWVVQHVKDWFA